ncbi:MAG: hypothetical protein H6733_12485 [Alphaproteobacteria bacterium]|nr:hypothetical protein [Alphaproteobacteria bacterium]
MTREPHVSVLFEHAARRGPLHGLSPLAYDPAYVDAQLPYFRTVFGPGRYFELDVSGWENLPPGPVMLVSNHSGGTTALDGFGLIIAWYDHIGTSRPLHGLAHELLFASPALGRYAERCGILRARPDLAREVLQDLRRDVLVMPGGDQDVWRPARDRYKVRFAGRTGYARTAVSLGIPIVPVAHVGAHHTLFVLTDGREVARRMGFVRRLARAEVWPVHLSVPWGLALGPWPHVPIPARLTYRLGAPITPLQGVSPRTAVAALDAAVRGSLQGMLTQMQEEGIGRPRGPVHAVRRVGQGLGAIADLTYAMRRGLADGSFPRPPDP